MQEQNEIKLNRAPVWRAFRAAAPQTLPVFAGYLVLGLGYGIYVQSLGLPVWLPPLMGTVVYGGSLEFVLPAAIFGMLIVYCLKDVSFATGSHGIPEAVAIGVTVALHKWKHQTLVSIAGGTLCYVLLVQMVF